MAAKSNNEKLVRIKMQRIPGGPSVNQDAFVSVNFKNYIIKRGEYVEVPEEVAEAIENSEEAETSAIKYAEEKGLREPSKEL